MSASLHFTDGHRAGRAAAHLGAVIRGLCVLMQLAQKITGRRRIVVAAYVDRRTAEDRAQDAAGLAVAVEVTFVGVGRTTAVSDSDVGHEVAPAGHVEMFFLTLFVAIADFARTVEREARAAIGREEPHLLSWKQRCAVDDVAQRQGAGTAGETDVDDHLDGYRAISDSHRVELPVVKIEHIAVVACFQIWTTGWEHWFGTFSV